MWSAFTVLVTLTLGGFWHGASWTFLLWGAMHGVFLIMHRGWEKLALVSRFKALQKIPPPLRWFAGVALTFNIVCVARAFFRLTHVSESLECLRKVVSFESGKLLSGGANDLSIWMLLISYGVATLCFAALRRGTSVPALFADLRGRPFVHGLLGGGAAGLLLVSILLARTGDKAPFIYFQF